MPSAKTATEPTSTQRFIALVMAVAVLGVLAIFGFLVLQGQVSLQELQVAGVGALALAGFCVLGIMAAAIHLVLGILKASSSHQAGPHCETKVSSDTAAGTDSRSGTS